MTTATVARVKVTVQVDERLVLRLAFDGEDVGLLVAYTWGEGLFLEHVVVFPYAPVGTLPALLNAGLEDARTREAKYVGIYQPAAGMDARLRNVATHYGFTATKRTKQGTYLIRSMEG